MAVVKVGPGAVSLTRGVVDLRPGQLIFWHGAVRMATILVGPSAFPKMGVVVFER